MEKCFIKKMQKNLLKTVLLSGAVVCSLTEKMYAPPTPSLNLAKTLTEQGISAVSFAPSSSLHSPDSGPCSLRSSLPSTTREIQEHSGPSSLPATFDTKLVERARANFTSDWELLASPIRENSMESLSSIPEEDGFALVDKSKVGNDAFFAQARTDNRSLADKVRQQGIAAACTTAPYVRGAWSYSKEPICLGAGTLLAFQCAPYVGDHAVTCTAKIIGYLLGYFVPGSSQALNGAAATFNWAANYITYFDTMRNLYVGGALVAPVSAALKYGPNLLWSGAKGLYNFAIKKSANTSRTHQDFPAIETNSSPLLAIEGAAAQGNGSWNGPIIQEVD